MHRYRGEQEKGSTFLMLAAAGDDFIAMQPYAVYVYS